MTLMNPTTNTEAGAVADVAAKLTEGMLRALMSMTEEPQFPGKATFNANGAHCLTYMRKPPLAEQVQKLTSARSNGRWRTAYRLTARGLDVKAHLTAGVVGGMGE